MVLILWSIYGPIRVPMFLPSEMITSRSSMHPIYNGWVLVNVGVSSMRLSK
jgi:hypothetical protein